MENIQWSDVSVCINGIKVEGMKPLIYPISLTGNVRLSNYEYEGEIEIYKSEIQRFLDWVNPKTVRMVSRLKNTRFSIVKGGRKK